MISSTRQDETRRTMSDSRDEIARFHAILSSAMRIAGHDIVIDVPVKDRVKTFPLVPKRDKDDPVRAWALRVYSEQYPSDKEPRIGNYNLARSQLTTETDIPELSQSQSQSSSSSRPSGSRKRKNPLTEEYERAISEVRERADYIVPAKEIGVTYARVPYTSENPGLTGLWRLDPNKPYQLLDCYLSFTDLNRPHSSSKSTDYSGTIRAVNTSGEEKTFTIDRDTLEDKGIDAKLKGFASWPHVLNHKNWLLEHIDFLMREKHVLMHDQQESLGWHSHPEYGLVWLSNNGIETEQGFIPSDKSPFVAPTALVPGNGYRSLTSPVEPSALPVELWTLLLEQLNPANWARMFAKLGAYMRVLFPEGTIERAGKLDFVIETVGDGTGQGKSSEDNYILSLLGTDFRYDLQSYLTADDTSPTRPRLMESVRFCLFSDYDRKARPGNVQFAKQHESRKQVIVQYADNTGGGLKMTAYGQKVVSRGTPQGGALLTGNYDHSVYSLESSEVEEDAYEYRACTFVLEQDERADRETSKVINARRDELSQWGTATRQWFMKQYNQDKQGLALRVQNWHAQADEIVRSIDRDWFHHRQQNACVDLVSGVLSWLSFLEDTYPETYQEHFLYQWLNTYMYAFIENRLDRADYMRTMVESRTGTLKLDSFVLDAIRTLLQTSQGYLVSQQDSILEPEDAPVSLSLLGYKHDRMFDGNEKWSTGQYKLGYYLPRKGAIAFNYDVLYHLLDSIAQKKNFPLPSKQDFKKKLAETGLSLVRRDETGVPTEYDAQVKINRVNARYILLDMRTLYPIEPETEQDEDEQGTPENIVSFPNRAHNVTVTVTPLPATLEQVIPVTQSAIDPFSRAIDDVPEE